MMRGLFAALAAFVSTIAFGNNVIVFEEGNHVVIDSGIGGESAAKFMVDAMSIESDEILVFIDSPGGSVFAGFDIINTIQGLQQQGKKVICYTNFAASMAFKITMYCDERIGSQTAVMMSHQYSYGLNPQPERNQKALIEMLEDATLVTDQHTADRMDLSLSEYRNMIAHDLWVVGVNNVRLGILDRIAPAVCSADLVKQTTETEFSFFGIRVKLTFSSCPLITYPISVVIGEIPKEEDKEAVEAKINQAIFEMFNKSDRI